MVSHVRGAGLVVLALLIFCCAFSSLGGSASASPYVPPELSGGVIEPPLGAGECPAAPEAYEGEDAVVAELRALRVEQVQSCAALLGSEVELVHRLWWVVAQQIEAEVGAVQLDKDLLAQLAPLEAAKTPGVQEVQVKGPSPLPVEDAEAIAVSTSGEGATGQLVAATEANGNVSHSDLWFLIGAVVVLVSAFAFYRLLVFR